jgi:hypothetical protein
MFKDLTIKPLSSVNLIVGKNNCGKTTLLEALELYFNRESSRSLRNTFNNILTKRNELDRIGTSEFPDDIWISSLKHLFTNHGFPKPNENGIKIGESEKKFGEINFRLYQTGLEDDRIKMLPLDHTLIDSDQLTDSQNIIPVIVYEEGGRIRHRFTSRERSRYFPIFMGQTEFISNGEKLPKTRFVSSSLIKYDELAELGDNILLTHDEHLVKEGLKIFDKDILDYSFQENNSFDLKGMRIPIVKHNQFSDPVPLRSFGDGIFRAFYILLSLVNSKGNVLLIDEFENGIHFTLHEKMWEFLFNLAKQNNIQIFATTHSYDCIQAFSKVWQKYPEDGSYLRLESSNGKSRAIVYDSQILQNSIESGLESR